jgi:superoxide dismutase, Cu-Zn family
MFPRIVALAVPATMIAACTNGIEVAPPPAAEVTVSASAWTVYQGSRSPSPAGSFPPDTVAAGTFLPFRAGATAVTYDPAVVPPGATAQVAIVTTPAAMTVRVRVAGLLGRRAYGAHLHVRECTAVPDEAGPHHQYERDPKSPSVDPRFANPRNEIWLDFTTDAAGAATAASEVRWSFLPGDAARSLVIHAQPTKTAAGVAGTAGPRVACLTLPAR